MHLEGSLVKGNPILFYRKYSEPAVWKLLFLDIGPLLGGD